MGVANPSRADLAKVAFLLVVAELLASFGCWSGLPMDAAPDWHFDFWYLEALRLRYWIPCFFCAFLAWLIIRWLVAARNTHAQDNVIRVLTNTALWLTAIVLAAGVEIGASVWYQRRVPWILSFGMSASYLPLYLQEHIIGWLVVVFFGAILWLVQVRRKWRHNKSESSSCAAAQ